MANGADVLAERLYEHGVRHIFGMPGSHSIAVYDAIFRHGGIHKFLIRNEQAGAFAADGYARVTGKPGVICTTAGPGATNALTGIAEAWADSIPLLLLTGQVNSDRMHEECGAYHEIDLGALFKPITKWCGTVRANDQIPEMVANAFRAMTSGRPRPAALILPQDLMAKPAPGDTEKRRSGEAEEEELSGEIKEAIRAGAQLLEKAERPIVLVGGGAVWSGAAAEIRALAERLNCPVITSLNGKGLLDERDHYSLGHARSLRAKAVTPHADAMLAVGCRFTEVMTELRRMKVPKNLVQIDIDPKQIGMNHPVAAGIVADAKSALVELVARLSRESRSRWGDLWDKARTLRSPKPEWLIDTLRAELPENAPVFTDASEMALRMQTDWPSYAPRRFFYPSNYISLGWGFPAAVGAAVGLPNTPIVSLSGDGGFLMTAQELATAARYSLHVIAIVHNDSAYGAMKHIQHKAFQDRFHDVELNNPDFVKFAESFGVPGHRARAANEFIPAIRNALARSGPTVIEVPDEWRSLRVSSFGSA